MYTMVGGIYIEHTKIFFFSRRTSALISIFNCFLYKEYKTVKDMT